MTDTDIESKDAEYLFITIRNSVSFINQRKTRSFRILNIYLNLQNLFHIIFEKKIVFIWI